MSNQSEEKQKKQTSFTELDKTNQASEKREIPWLLENQDKQVIKRQEDKPTTPLKNNTEQFYTVISEETEQPDGGNYCFASSLLNSLQNRKLLQVLERFNIPFSKTVTPDVSHLIVGTINRRTQNSYKFLYAMALHKYIISFDWVELVLVENTDQIIPMVSFALEQ